VPALAGALVVATAGALDAGSPALGAGVAGAVFAVRALALRRHWHGPRARLRRSPRRGGRIRRGAHPRTAVTTEEAP